MLLCDSGAVLVINSHKLKLANWRLVINSHKLKLANWGSVINSHKLKLLMNNLWELIRCHSLADRCQILKQDEWIRGFRNLTSHYINTTTYISLVVKAVFTANCLNQTMITKLALCWARMRMRVCVCICRWRCVHLLSMRRSAMYHWNTEVFYINSSWSSVQHVLLLVKPRSRLELFIPNLWVV